jgi:hypothetical protein
MDAPSRSVAAFLESLQDAMKRLGDVWGHYLRHGTEPNRPFLVLSGSPFSIHEGDAVRQFRGCVALGLQVKGADGRKYELGIDVLWDAERWTVATEAWVEAGAGGQDLLRQLPERTAPDLDGCLAHLGAAVGHLVSFADLVPGKVAAAEPFAAPDPAGNRSCGRGPGR